MNIFLYRKHGVTLFSFFLWISACLSMEDSLLEGGREGTLRTSPEVSLNILNSEAAEYINSLSSAENTRRSGKKYYKKACKFAKEKDINQAFQYYKKAADYDHSKSMYILAGFYDKGVVVSRSRQEALQEAFGWFLKAANKNHSKAALEVAKRYRDGIGIDRSEEEALRFYQLAAILGEEEAERYLVSVRLAASYLRQAKKPSKIRDYAQKFSLFSSGIGLVSQIVSEGLKRFGCKDYVDTLRNFSNYAKISGGISETIVGIDSLYNDGNYSEISRVGVGFLMAVDGYISLSTPNMNNVMDCREKCRERIEKGGLRQDKELNILIEDYKNTVEDFRNNSLLHKRAKASIEGARYFLDAISKIREVTQEKRKLELNDLFYFGNIICDVFNMQKNAITISDGEYLKLEGKNIIEEFSVSEFVENRSAEIEEWVNKYCKLDSDPKDFITLRFSE